MGLRTFHQVVGEAFRERRVAAKLQQDEIARQAQRMGLWQFSQATISAIEAGRRAIDVSEYPIFAFIFSKATDRLIPALDLIPNHAEWIELAPNVKAWLPSVRHLFAPVGDTPVPPGKKPLIEPIEEWPEISEPDRVAARKLHVAPELIATTAKKIWKGKTLAQERDARLDDPAASAQKRGRITRALHAELKRHIRGKRRKT